MIIYSICEYLDVYITLGQCNDNTLHAARDYVASYFISCIFSKIMRRRDMVLWIYSMYSYLGLSFSTVWAVVSEHPLYQAMAYVRYSISNCMINKICILSDKYYSCNGFYEILTRLARRCPVLL